MTGSIIVLCVGVVCALVWIGQIVRQRRRGDPDLIVWASDPATFSPTPESWPLAASALYASAAKTPWDVFEYSDPARAQEVLRVGWQVTTRQELLSRLLWLLVEGHRVPFAQEIRVWSEHPTADAVTFPADADGLEAAWRFDQVRGNVNGIRSVDFTAWDMTRFILLCRAGATIGLISPEEARDFVVLAQWEIGEHYPDWTVFGEQFAVGRWYWNSEAGRRGRSDLRATRVVNRALAHPSRGPWTIVPYGTAAQACRWLFVPALADAHLIRPLSAEERAGATPWQLRLDDVLADRRR